MKIKKDFMLREVAGSHVVVAVGEASETFNGMIKLNGIGAFLWSMLSSGAEEEELLAAVLENYEVDAERASRDIAIFLEKLKGANFLE